ncbi:MAG: hypothetical protein P8Y63_09440, partial [Deltaproteobacteria bacterium]
EDPDDRFVIPFGSVYLWRHPDENLLFRAELSGLYNNVFYAPSPTGWGPFEWVATFNNFTLPFARSEIVDGENLESEELTWGYVRPGFGLGYRRQTWPGKEDNMFAVDLLIEPGFVYFDKSNDAAADFVAPHDTSEVLGHLELRWDSMLRNILSRPHRGFALGADAVYGHRFQWESWGIDSEESAGAGRNYQYVTGYLVAAGGVPFVASERHRLVGAFYGGIGHHLDRFNAPRVGGGPAPMGEEYGSTYWPTLPGAAFWEFFPRNYAILLGEYRWEPLFFLYFHVRGSVARLDRLRRNDSGQVYHSEDTFGSIGIGTTSGFFFESRLCLDYSYNTSVIRDGSWGANAVVLRISKTF